MKFIYLFLLLSSISFAQETFTYTGVVSDSSGPIPGANVTVKGESKGVSTGFDGKYSIKVKEGDVLVISYMGMKDVTLKVTKNHMKKGVLLKSSMNTAIKKVEKTIAVQTLVSKDYQLEKEEKDTLLPVKPSGSYFFYDNQYRFGDLQKITKGLNKVYHLQSGHDFLRIYFEANLQTTITTPFTLPQYQNTYAQGRSINGNLTYQSPQSNEIFSWGPNVNTLEYSNINSPYYTQGEIVTKGNGNGKSVKLYDENDFYKPYVNYRYSISSTIKNNNNEYFKFLCSFNQDRSFLENVRNSSWTSSINTFKNLTKKWALKTSFSYDYNKDNFSQSNFGWTKVMYANAIRPIHFNPQDNLILADGTVRNYSKFENNPYFLLNYNQDTSTSNQFSGLLDMKYKFNDSYLNFIVSGQQSNLENTNALLPNAALVTTPSFDTRNEKYSMFNGTAIFNTQIEYKTTLEGRLQFTNQNRTLFRNFYNGYTSVLNFPNDGVISNAVYNHQSRNEASVYVEAKHKFEDVFGYYNDSLEFTGNTSLTISSTLLDKTRYTGNLGMNLKNIFNSRIDLVSSYNYNQMEPSLQNNNLNFNSLRYALKDVNSLYNSQELFTSQQTIPTTEKQFRVGAEANFYRWNFSMEWFTKKVTDVYAPVVQNKIYQWHPAFDFQQKGIEIDVKKTFYFRYTNNNYYSVALNFATYKNKVTAIKTGQNVLPIAGFGDMYKGYVEGQPLGVLIGYGYARDANGQMIIGADGFPLQDNQPRILGNPNPDFNVGFDHVIKFNKITVNLTFDWQKGGQMWNGTEQVLDYYGKSAKTETERNLTGYVFSGVTTSGAVNTTPVSFYDPQLPVEQNRWVRYGVTGTSEDNIIDASYFRLNNVKVTYDGSFRNSRAYTYQISVFANNVFIISKNNSAFINNPLFNSVETTGLQFFNSPLAFQSGIAVNIKF
ncbi:MAG: carboxypeptidase-like regulatory domain-containing protein [Limnohabitans sp.]|nr:carboxypeptidase-like regulatory domain-containing protein [Limnohabitans sp.]